MKTNLLMFAVLVHLSPSSAMSDTEVEKNEPVRPGDEAGSMPPSDGLAECAAILVVASENSRNFVSRKNMGMSSRDWFATAGLLAIEEVGEVPDIEVWEGKVSEWSQRIGSIEAMIRQEDWMAYCSDMGSKHGLDNSHFSVASE